MNSECSISQWLGSLKAGDLAAIEVLWRRYAARLVELARHELRRAPKSGADEEDIAQSVFRNICRGAAAGRLQSVNDHDELWWLLIAITKQKVVDHIRRETTQRRGGGRVICETDLAIGTTDRSPASLANVIAEEPTPEFIVTLEEEAQRLLAQLRNDALRQIATWRIEGYTVNEIADFLQISPRSVERKLQLIRKAWARELMLDTHLNT